MRAKIALFVWVGLLQGLLPARVAQADSATEEARQHYLKGNQFFDVGRWDEAAEEYEKGYTIKSDPSFLYNMAQAFRRKGDAKRAIDLYKNYLIKAPSSPQRADVEERIRVLQKQLDDAEAMRTQGTVPPALVAPTPMPPPGATTSAPTYAPIPTTPTPASAQTDYGAPPSPPALVTAPPPEATMAARPAPTPAPLPGYAPAPAPVVLAQTTAATEPPPSPGRGLRVAGITCGLGGAAFVGAGIVFGALTKSVSDSVQNGDVFNPSDDDRGKLYESLQWVSYGVGAGLLVTGAVLYGIGAVHGARANVAVAPAVLPGGAGISAGGTF